jgi:hypothetical protein
MMSKRKNVDGLFDGRHFDREIIILCVRWYLRYKLSLRDLVEMMSERGIVNLLMCGRMKTRRMRMPNLRGEAAQHRNARHPFPILEGLR